MKLLPGVPESRAERPATAVLHDEPNVRVVGFHLLADQEIAPHRSPSTVTVQVLEGEGLFRGDGGEVTLRTGQTMVFAPNETHAMKPVGGALRFLAILSPSPG
jgi:quercetin dioxygenase-like cupin family protein